MDPEKVVELACNCVDQDGNAQPSLELIEAVAALDYTGATRLWYAVGITRGAMHRMRPLPAEAIVGTVIFRVLGRLAGNPGAFKVLEEVLRRQRCPTG